MSANADQQSAQPSSLRASSTGTSTVTDVPFGDLDPAVRTTRSLGAADRAVVHGLVAAAEDGGGEPLAEDARLVVDGATHHGVQVHHLLAGSAPDPGSDGSEAPAGAAQASLAGYAQVRRSAGDDEEVTVELLVAPTARRRGVGAALARAVAEVLAGDAGAGGHGALTAWAHGDHPGATALAGHHGLVRERELWRMERALDGGGDLPPPALPDGVALRAFEPGRDEAGWLALNAAAFADHPEQGAWEADDLAARTSAPWFDPADLLLLVDAAAPGHPLASHWTKVDGAVGEVYVVAVAPEQQGRGLGRAAVLAGLHHLAQRGARRVELYVDGHDARARHLYERLGFTRASTDVAWGRRW